MQKKRVSYNKAQIRSNKVCFPASNYYNSPSVHGSMLFMGCSHGVESWSEAMEWGRGVDFGVE